MSVEILTGDSLALLQTLPNNSIDAVVTDPPYGLEFMGKEWDTFKTGRAAKYAKGGTLDVDGIKSRAGKGGAGPSYVNRPAKRCAVCGKQEWSGSPCQCEHPEWTMDNSPLHAYQAWCLLWAKELLRVLKPGGHLLSFGGTRTHHRMTCAIEDAGFEIRDELDWLYGSGFPKSHNVAIGIDKQLGAMGHRGKRYYFSLDDPAGGEHSHAMPTHDPISEEAKPWKGWGTALKPAREPIVLARKPLEGTVAANVLAYGTGGLNIDGTRIGSPSDKAPAPLHRGESKPLFTTTSSNNLGGNDSVGRWAANVLFDEAAAAELDEQSGETSGGSFSPPNARLRKGFMHGEDGAEGSSNAPNNYGDTGGASRFFYVAKPGKREKNAGLDEFAIKDVDTRTDIGKGSWTTKGIAPQTNNHPTVKPITLMRYLVRLITPPGGTVLDPFCGSGTTGCAAVLEGFNFLGMDMTPEYAEIAKARIAYWSQHLDTPLKVVKKSKRAPSAALPVDDEPYANVA